VRSPSKCQPDRWSEEQNSDTAWPAAYSGHGIKTRSGLFLNVFKAATETDRKVFKIPQALVLARHDLMPKCLFTLCGNACVCLGEQSQFDAALQHQSAEWNNDS